MKQLIATFIAIIMLTQSAFCGNPFINYLLKNPESFADEIVYHLNRVSNPGYSPSYMDDLLSQVLKIKAKDNIFTSEVFDALNFEDLIARNSGRETYYKQYANESLIAARKGNAPVKAAEFLKLSPANFKEDVFVLLKRGNLSFGSLVKTIEARLGLNNTQATALAVSYEAEFARNKIGTELQHLRGTNRFLKKLYKKPAKGPCATASWGKKESIHRSVRANNTEITRLKHIASNTEGTMSHVMGQKEYTNMVNTVRQTKGIGRYLTKIPGPKPSFAIKNVVSKGGPKIAFIALFLFLLSDSLDAHDVSGFYNEEVSSAVSKRLKMNQMVIEVAHENTELLGVIYGTNRVLTSIIDELIEGQSSMLPPASHIYMKLEAWEHNLTSILNDPESLNDYIADIKKLNDDATAAEREEHQRQLKHNIDNIQMQQDNTRVYKAPLLQPLQKASTK